MALCPCCSGESFAKCCEPVIKEESASSALALMRSRFTAYCVNQTEYLFNTTHPKTRNNTSLNAIEEWSKENKWTKLEIKKTKKGTKKDVNGVVEFKAHFIDLDGNHQIHHEKSNFQQEKGKWFYRDGIVNRNKPVIEKTFSRNAPCICGSGLKYKKCCG